MIEQDLSARFNAEKDQFASRWREGMNEWFQQWAPGHLVAMQLAEQALDTAWIDARREQKVTPAFEAELVRWRGAHVAAIAEFENKSVGVIR